MASHPKTGHDRLERIRRGLTPASALGWGRTPWDELPREDLIFLLQSQHAVLRAAHVALRRFESMGEPGTGALLSSLQASCSHVFSDHLPPIDIHGAFGRSEVRPLESEEDLFSKYVMRPVDGQLAFDVPTTTWWYCDAGQFAGGGAPDRPPTCLCARMASEATDDVPPCRMRHATWDDWRTHRDPPPRKDGADA